jgi:hypothetical protein
LAWFGGHPLRAAAAAIAAILLLGASAKISGPPQADRNWYPYLAHASHVDVNDGVFRVAPVSDWGYAAAGPTAERYTEAQFALSDLREVWFVLEPQPGSTLAAHTLLLFEFSDDRLIGLTIEARREADEDYSALAGIWNSYELLYLWGSARDFLTRRVIMLDHEVFVYPVAISDEQKAVLLQRLIARTDELETRPRYYNTIFSNCTNELAKAAGFHWAPAFILTGQSDEYLFERGILPGPDFDTAHRASDMTAFVRGLNEAAPEDFDRLLLEELRRRAAELEPPHA